METTNKNLWRITINNIYDKILEASDITLQRKLWLNENNNTGLIFSYAELMCGLFDDNNFDQFIDTEAYKHGFTQKTISELNKLRCLLNEYEEKPTDAEIIEDKEWVKITIQAKICIAEWN